SRSRRLPPARRARHAGAVARGAGDLGAAVDRRALRDGGGGVRPAARRRAAHRVVGGRRARHRRGGPPRRPHRRRGSRHRLQPGVAAGGHRPHDGASRAAARRHRAAAARHGARGVDLMRPLAMVSHSTARVPRTWRSKLLLLLVGFSMVPLFAQALWDYLATRHAYETTTLESLQGLAHAKAQAIDQLTRDRRTQIERVASLIVARVRALTVATAAGAVPSARAPQAMPMLKDAEALPTSGPPANPD